MYDLISRIPPFRMGFEDKNLLFVPIQKPDPGKSMNSIRLFLPI